MALIQVSHKWVFPNTYISMTLADLVLAYDLEPEPGEEALLVLPRIQVPASQLSEDTVYPIGLKGSVLEVQDDGIVLIQTRDRVRVDELRVDGDRISCKTVPMQDTEKMDEETREKKRDRLMLEVIRATGGNAFGDLIVDSWLHLYRDFTGLVCALSEFIPRVQNGKLYEILQEDSEPRRAEMQEKLIYAYLRKTGKPKPTGTQDSPEAREEAIRYQTDAVQREATRLSFGPNADLDAMELKIRNSGMNDTARREAEKILRRLYQQGTFGAETGMLYNYLDFLTNLSWKKEDAREIDLDAAERILDEDHYGLRKVKSRILQQIAVMSLTKAQSGSILLFVGAPGTGKTSIGQSIARALSRQYVRVSLGGIRDEGEIRGHRRTYIGAMPGRIMDAISKSGVSNPVMVLDEVDKLISSSSGDPASALLEVLDPEQNRTFTDHYMNVPYDLSDVLFICTANSVDTIPEPLLSRMEVIQFQGYTPMEKEQIAIRHLLPRAMAAVGISEGQLKVTEETVRSIIRDYTREGGVRGLKKCMDTLCRAAAVQIVRGKGKGLEVTQENLRAYLDMHPLPHRCVPDAALPGVVTGLAWTSSGGDVLSIETLLTCGKGEIQITGRLGDVMKESVQVALSLVKHLFPDRAEVLGDHDLHVHVPDGATPKDGPSAGITLAVAIASLLMDRPVDPRLAMTGEITLRGEVEAIGGLPEKLIAAQRAGVRQVLIPQDNMEDLSEVPEETRTQLTVTPVRTIADVLHICGMEEAR
ncbi:MAG: endopeptidase La [Clostridia bacterium]|nr:endopeptidase La [Clostridia bacterium]